MQLNAEIATNGECDPPRERMKRNRRIAGSQEPVQSSKAGVHTPSFRVAAQLAIEWL